MPPTSPTNAVGDRARGRPCSKASSLAAVVGTQWWCSRKAAISLSVTPYAGKRRTQCGSACVPLRWTSRWWAPSLRPWPQRRATSMSTPARRAASSRPKSPERSPTPSSGLRRRPSRRAAATRRSPRPIAWWRRHWSRAGRPPSTPDKRRGSSPRVSRAVPRQTRRAWPSPRTGARPSERWPSAPHAVAPGHVQSCPTPGSAAVSDRPSRPRSACAQDDGCPDDLAWGGRQRTGGAVHRRPPRRLERCSPARSPILGRESQGKADEEMAQLLPAKGLRSSQHPALLASTVQRMRLRHGRLQRYGGPRHDGERVP